MGPHAVVVATAAPRRPHHPQRLRIEADAIDLYQGISSGARVIMAN
jgi:hypothetical protein